MTDIVISTNGLSICQKSQLAAKLCEGLELSFGKVPQINRAYVDFENGSLKIKGIDYAMPDAQRALRDKAEDIQDKFMVLTESDEGQE